MREKIAPKMVLATKGMIEDRGFQERHIVDPGRDFTRNRKIGFSGTMMYVLGNCRESMELNSEKYAEVAKIGSISAAAICKARGKIDYTAFEEVFEESAKLMPIDKTYHGYELIAGDGMKGELPNLPSLKETYPVHEQQGYPMFHAMSLYDMYNEVFIAASFRPAPANERQMVMELMDKPGMAEGHKIFMLDRGFPSVELMYKLEEIGQKYVMRVSGNFLKEVNEFTRSKAIDKSIPISYDTDRAGKGWKGLLPWQFSIRCVRVRLENDTEEILITNLPRKAFPKRKIKELYHLRWGIETSYNYLKHALYIEEFTSRKDNGIKQDFYASLWAANVTNAAIADAMPPTIQKN